MEVKPGYKQTEAGIIPEEWEVRSLAEVCSKITDGTHDTPTPVRSGVPFLTAIHIKENFIDYEGCLFLTEEDHRIIFARCNPKRGDVLMVNIGAGVATTAFVDVDFEFSLKNVALLKPANSLSFGRFLNHCLIRRKAAITQALSSGGAQPFLSLTQIGQIRIPAPPLPEQRAIAEALSDVDGLLGGLDRLIAKKRDLKQAAMQQLLTGQTRLPGFHGEWGKCRLSSFVRSHNSGVYKKSEHYGQGTNIVGVSDIYGVDCIDGQMFAQVPLSAAEKAKHTLRTNDLLYGESSLVREGIARTVHVTERGAGTAFAWHTRRYSVDQSVLMSSFLKYYLQGRRARQHMMDNCIQTAITGINTVAYFACPVLLPSLPEQTAIAEVLTEMDAELAALEQRREKTRALKQAMMQELLTGRTRLV